MANQSNDGSNPPPQVEEINLISNYVPERCIQNHQYLNHVPNSQVDLNLSLGGDAGKVRPILPKGSMPHPSSSSAAAIGGVPTSRRRMSWKQRAREANRPAVPQEVPPPELSEAAIDSVQSNNAFQRAIALLKSSGEDDLPAQPEGEGTQVEPTTLIDPAANVSAPPQPTIIPSTSNENPGTSSMALHNAAQSNEEAAAKDENMEQMFRAMPRVTTSGGHGREIEGFLFQFYQGRISIVCVCHGYFLSPEQFVQHAGGRDVANPMRHIYIKP